MALAVGVAAGAGIGAAVAVLAAGSPAAHHRSGVAKNPAPAVSAPPTTSAVAALAAAVTMSPSSGATRVAPDATVTVSAGSGQLTSVTVATAGGHPLAGSLDAAGTRWTSTGPLAPSSTYRITAVVTGRSGATATRVSSFSTLTPTALVGVGLWPDSGLTVGVGQPIVLTFTQPIITPSARTGLLSHLHLAMSEPVAVGAYWFSDYELHLRPRDFWPAHEKIFFSDDLAGWNAGSGEWGQGSGSVSFAIGDSRISTANLVTHEMTVTLNGKVVATYPISAGNDQYPTMDGTHIVLDRQSVVRMDSATVGIPVDSPNGYDELVYWDVHISDSGEYVHAAPWSVGAQGNTNVSHGCINISPANAKQFFNFSRVGDVVKVINGPRKPVATDHGVADWSTAQWSQMTPIPVSQQR